MLHRDLSLRCVGGNLLKVSGSGLSRSRELRRSGVPGGLLSSRSRSSSSCESVAQSAAALERVERTKVLEVSMRLIWTEQPFPKCHRRHNDGNDLVSEQA